jgi:hypothetical protein
MPSRRAKRKKFRYVTIRSDEDANSTSGGPNDANANRSGPSGTTHA